MRVINNISTKRLTTKMGIFTELLLSTSSLYKNSKRTETKVSGIYKNSKRKIVPSGYIINSY